MATAEPAGLELTEEEAFALLAMCLTSPHAIDKTSEAALRKLAAYCIAKSNHSDPKTIGLFEEGSAEREIERAGA